MTPNTKTAEEILLKHTGNSYSIAQRNKIVAAMTEYANLKSGEQWVSVDTELPKDCQVVLVWSNTSIQPTIAFYFKNDWMYYNINHSCFWISAQPHIKIIAWRELPSPPKQ